jgi:hypothetical protein
LTVFAFSGPDSSSPSRRLERKPDRKDTSRTNDRHRDRSRRSPDRQAQRAHWTERKYTSPKLRDTNLNRRQASRSPKREERERGEFSQRHGRPTVASERVTIKREPNDSPPLPPRLPLPLPTPRKDAKVENPQEGSDRKRSRYDSPGNKDAIRNSHRRVRRSSSDSDRGRKVAKRVRSRSPARRDSRNRLTSRRRSSSSSSSSESDSKRKDARAVSPNDKYRRLAAAQTLNVKSESSRRRSP